MQDLKGSADELLEQARSVAQDSTAASAEHLRQYLAREHVLTWLASVTQNPTEALAAVKLALCLNPDDEVAQQAIAAVYRETVTAGRGLALGAQRVEQPAPPAKPAFETGLTLAEARAVLWPFEGGKQTIGELLDSGAKTLRDLAWAYGKANSRQVRDACKTLLLAQLLDAEPKEPRRPLRVLSGSRYLEQQEREALVTMGRLHGAVITLFVVGLIVAVVSAVAVVLGGGTVADVLAGQVALGGVVVFYLILGAMWLLVRGLERRSKRALNFRVGRWGEEQIVEPFRAALDGRWTLVRNFVSPGRRSGDIDLILVGPPGVWACEVKTYAGLVRNRGDEWERKTTRGWARLGVHPGRQARANAVGLKTLLEQAGVALAWVEPAVIWASSEAADAEQRGMLVLEHPQTPVWRADQFLLRVEEVAQQAEKLGEAQVAQVVAVVERALKAGLNPAQE